MAIRAVQAALVGFAICATAPLAVTAGASAPRPRPSAARPSPAVKKAKRSPLPCGDLLGFQVLLDRQGFSPGEIDGKKGDNLTHALAAFQASRKITTVGTPDCETWRALGGDTTGSLIATYTVTQEDAKGPFIAKMPPRIEQQARLPELGYRSLREKLAERFHAAPAFLEQLNHGAPIAAGRALRVPATQPFDPNVKPVRDANAGDVTIQVLRDASVMRATRGDGTIVFFAPVSSGSEHDPLPLGDWKVTSVNWRPVFHYNPHLFWDATPDQNRATLKPGPNNPVGVVWIGLNIEHYGMHGTPEPGRVGHAQSHGCVRLTNWDAARLASLVKPGTPVVFLQ
jgi:lipoprotein-anchoring transpeptidase ErfK/SrfK